MEKGHAVESWHARGRRVLGALVGPPGDGVCLRAKASSYPSGSTGITVCGEAIEFPRMSKDVDACGRVVRIVA